MFKNIDQLNFYLKNKTKFLKSLRTRHCFFLMQNSLRLPSRTQTWETPCPLLYFFINFIFLEA